MADVVSKKPCPTCRSGGRDRQGIIRSTIVMVIPIVLRVVPLHLQMGTYLYTHQKLKE
jgi:hypothetical protein